MKRFGSVFEIQSKLHDPSMFAVKAKINPALSLLMKHLLIGQRQKAPFSALHRSPHRWSAFRNHEGSTFTEKDRYMLNYRSGPKHGIGPGCAGRA